MTDFLIFNFLLALFIIECYLMVIILNQQHQTGGDSPNNFIVIFSHQKTKPTMSSMMKGTSFGDLFFVRMKLQNSFDLPKSPQKTPKFNLNTKNKSVMFSNKKQVSEKLLKSKTTPSKDQIDVWMAEKEIQVKGRISRENYRNFKQNNQITLSDEILLKDQFKCLQKTNAISSKSISTFNKSQYQQLSDTMTLDSRLSALKNTYKNSSPYQRNLKSIKTFQPSQDSFRCNSKLNQKFTTFPVLLKIKQAKQKLNHSFHFESQLSQCTDRSRTELSTSLKHGEINRKKTEKNFKPQNKNQRSLIVKSKEQNDTQDQSFMRQSLSFVQKKSQYSRKYRSFRSPLYQHNSKAPQPIKKYSNKQVSPNEKKNLLNKYSCLQNRLNNILRYARS